MQIKTVACWVTCYLLLVSCTTAGYRCGVVLPPVAERLCDKHRDRCPDTVLGKKESKRLDTNVRLGVGCTVKVK